jgi:hypothetical protein
VIRRNPTPAHTQPERLICAAHIRHNAPHHAPAQLRGDFHFDQLQRAQALQRQQQLQASDRQSADIQAQRRQALGVVQQAQVGRLLAAVAGKAQVAHSGSPCWRGGGWRLCRLPGDSDVQAGEAGDGADRWHFGGGGAD